MLTVRLRKALGDFSLDLAFTAADREVTAIFGKSGAGKSSLVRLLAGLEQPDLGRVELNGRLLFDGDGAVDLPPHLRKVGLVFQDGRLLPHYSVRGNLRFGLERSPIERRYIGFDDVVGLLGLERLLERRPATLSGGEKQRVAIGRALLSSPDLLVMDEPLAALDGARKNELLDYITLLSGQFDLPILYVSHDPEEILRIAAKMLLLQSGQIVAAGAVEQVMCLPQFADAAGNRSRVSIINAKVEHCQDGEASMIRFAGGLITVPKLNLPVGRSVRAQIKADQVILANQPIGGISVRNQLAAQVVALTERDGLIDVELEIGGRLFAEISPQACRDLALVAGKSVTALIKSAAIRPVGSR